MVIQRSPSAPKITVHVNDLKQFYGNGPSDWETDSDGQDSNTTQGGHFMEPIDSDSDVSVGSEVEEGAITASLPTRRKMPLVPGRSVEVESHTSNSEEEAEIEPETYELTCGSHRPQRIRRAPDRLNL